MAPQKRKHTEEPIPDPVHPSRQSQVPGALSKPPSKKPRRIEPPVYRKQQHASSVNAIKKRIRDVTRKLERSDSLPANLRAEDERALAAYQQELLDAEAEKLRNRMISKYHMVRFFERQKATRAVKKLRKRILEADTTAEVESLNAQMHIAEVDLNYTQFCPLNEVYVSLYPPKSDTKDCPDVDVDMDASLEPAPKPPIWHEVEAAMSSNTLSKLRNRAPIFLLSSSTSNSKPQSKSSNKPTKSQTTKQVPIPKPQHQPTIDTTGLNRRERRRAERGPNEVQKTKNKSIGFLKNQEFGASMAAKSGPAVGEADDSDGGFFED